MNIESLEKDGRISETIKNAVDEWCDNSNKEETEVVKEYHSYVLRKWAFVIACAVAVIISTGLYLSVGEYSMSFLDCYATLWNHITGNIQDSVDDYIIWNNRLPNVLTGLVAGTALSICGVMMQGILKNPLADPYTTGVSSGAGFGATLAIGLGASIVDNQYSIVLNAFIFSLIPTMAIIGVSKLKNASPTTMIMAGIAVMYIFNALSTFIKLWGDPDSLSSILQWQTGSIGGLRWSNVVLLLVVTAIGYILIQGLSRKLNVLSAGDDNAKALGLDVDRLRILSMMVVALLAAAVVSFTGLIGFVGLVAPHMVRLVIGADNRYLVPASALFGSALLLCSDMLGKIVLAPAVIPVGVITSFLGGPVFLWLIVRKKSEVWG